jgi:hypothetical protein
VTGATRSGRFLSIIGVAALLGVAPFMPAPSIVVDPSRVGPRISGHVLGVGMATWFDVTLPGIAQSFKTIGAETTRWPGGFIADVYDWRSGRLHQPCAGRLYANPHSTFDAFMRDVAVPANLDVTLQVNYGSNERCSAGADPADAAAWVSYANRTKGYHVTWWSVGNEQWNPRSVDLHSTPHDALQYARLEAAEYYAQMKAASPIPINVCADVNPRIPTWDAGVLPNARYDCVDMHYYAQGNVVDDERLVRYGASNLSKLIEKLRSELTQAGHAKTPIYVGEIGSTGGRPGKQTQSIAAALYAAQVLGELTNEGITRATWWLGYSNCYYPDGGGDFDPSLYGWQNYGGAFIFSPGANENCRDANLPPFATPLATADAFTVASYFIRDGEHVVGFSSNPDPDVRAYAATYGTGFALLLVNRNETAAFAVPVRIEGRTSGPGGKVVTYDEALYAASKGGTWLGPSVQSLPAWKGGFSIDLPPWSAVAVQVK